MKIYPIGEFSKLTGYSTQTLRNWDYKDILKPYNKSEGGKRFYSEDQLNHILNKNTEIKKIVGYCRVSSHKQKDDLERQEENMRTYLISKGLPFEIITDIGSGINYKNPGLLKIIHMINTGEISKVVVLYKDRLIRFGFELIEYLANINGVEIEIVEEKKKTDEEELVNDLVQIITVFSARLQGKRARKVKKIIEDIKVANNKDD